MGAGQCHGDQAVAEGLDPKGFPVGQFAVSLHPGGAEPDVIAYSSRVREGRHRVAGVNAPGCRQMGAGDDIAQGRLPRFIPLPAVTMPTTALARGAAIPAWELEGFVGV